VANRPHRFGQDALAAVLEPAPDEEAGEEVEPDVELDVEEDWDEPESPELLAESEVVDSAFFSEPPLGTPEPDRLSVR
jgi:hypothetical protein